MESNIKYNCIFKNAIGECLIICLDGNKTIEDLIHSYFKRKGKENLFINNIENTYFIYNIILIDYKSKQKLSSFFRLNVNPTITVLRLEDKDKYDDLLDRVCEKKLRNIEDLTWMVFLALLQFWQCWECI